MGEYAHIYTIPSPSSFEFFQTSRRLLQCFPLQADEGRSSRSVKADVQIEFQIRHIAITGYETETNEETYPVASRGGASWMPT